MAQTAHSSKRGHTLPIYPVYLVSPSRAAHLLLEGRRLICLMRHGQTDWNQIKRLQGRENVPLNETGIRQACHTAELFRRSVLYGVRFGKVCTSPLSRAADTAGFIQAALDNPAIPCDVSYPPVHMGEPVILPQLIERDYGSLSGLTLEERRHQFPGGERQAGDVESVPAAAARMCSAFDDMMEAVPEHAIIGVTHGGILNAVFSRLTSGEIGTGKSLSVNCSVSFIAAGIGSPIPLAYNLQEQGILDYLRKMVASGADF